MIFTVGLTVLLVLGIYGLIRCMTDDLGGD